MAAVLEAAPPPPADAQTYAADSPGAAGRWLKLASNPWFAHGTLLLLQLRRMWGIFRYHELTGGDTSFYFTKAYAWSHWGRGDFAWSPLYTFLYGSLLHFSSDAAFVTALHRVLIACTATLLVLAVMRRMLPAPLAWLTAAWWAVMPNDFDTRYEVHLFALLPVLIAWLTIISWNGAWGRGTAVAVLLASALLVRNEMLLAAACLSLVCSTWEWRAWRGAPPGRRAALSATGMAYAVPVALALCVAAWFYQHSSTKGVALRSELARKHATNMAKSTLSDITSVTPNGRATRGLITVNFAGANLVCPNQTSGRWSGGTPPPSLNTCSGISASCPMAFRTCSSTPPRASATPITPAGTFRLIRSR